MFDIELADWWYSAQHRGAGLGNPLDVHDVFTLLEFIRAMKVADVYCMSIHYEINNDNF